jgi:repressor LexA
MYVQVTVEIGVIPTAVHHQEMRSAARSLTNDKNSVHVAALKDGEMEITAVFTINTARQMDVVDKIGRRFWNVEGYQGCSINFPKLPPAWYPHQPAVRFTWKQGQYLAFIHYYSKINGRSPAEQDMQRHFQVTPPTVHRMVLELEKRGLISRLPRQPRSITLLVSRDEIPDLD